MTAIMEQGRWVVTYESQGCYDDGGVGHDDFWTKRRHTLEGSFDSDEKAVKAAKAWIRKQNGTYPCRGSFCSNKGLYRLIEVEFVVPEQRRSARSDSGSNGDSCLRCGASVTDDDWRCEGGRICGVCSGTNTGTGIEEVTP